MIDVATRVPRGAVGALVRRPDLWPTVVAQALRLARHGWWREPPYLPVPPEEYLRFRMVTNYGGDGDPAAATGRDLVAYLEWCRAWPRVTGRG